MRIVSLLAALAFCTPVLAGPKDVVRPYPAQKVHADIYVIHGPQGVPSVANQSFMNNPAWVITADGVVVIDPGSSVQAGRMVMAQLRKTTTKPVTHVFNTHVHGDHWLGNQAVLEVWPKATLIGHPDMIKRAREGADAFWIKLMSDVTKGYTDGTAPRSPRSKRPTARNFGSEGRPCASIRHGCPQQDRPNDRDRRGPHSLHRRQCALPAGDESARRHLQGVMKETERALALDARLYVPGHGKSGDRKLVEEQKAWFDILMPEVRRLYDEGKSDFEMKPVIAEKLKAYKQWAEFEANLGPMVSLAILEIEQE